MFDSAMPRDDALSPTGREISLSPAPSNFSQTSSSPAAGARAPGAQAISTRTFPADLQDRGEGAANAADSARSEQRPDAAGDDVSVAPQRSQRPSASVADSAHPGAVTSTSSWREAADRWRCHSDAWFPQLRGEHVVPVPSAGGGHVQGVQLSAEVGFIVQRGWAERRTSSPAKGNTPREEEEEEEGEACNEAARQDAHTPRYQRPNVEAAGDFMRLKRTALTSAARCAEECPTCAPHACAADCTWAQAHPARKQIELPFAPFPSKLRARAGWAVAVVCSVLAVAALLYFGTDLFRAGRRPAPATLGCGSSGAISLYLSIYLCMLYFGTDLFRCRHAFYHAHGCMHAYMPLARMRA